MFPWMCDVANRFEKYKFSRVCFRYVPQSAAVAGTVTLAFDFDPNDDAPIDMSEATTFHDYVSTSIWQSATLQLDLTNGDRLPQKNTRPGLPSGDVDLNVYDVGRLHVMTEGAIAATIGYIEVLYDVDLFIHQIQPGVGGAISASAGLAAGSLIGTNAAADPQAILPFVMTSASTLTFTQPWEGLVGFKLTGTAFSDIFVTNTGTCTFENSGGVYSAAATSWWGLCRIRAQRGQTFIPRVGATTVATSTLLFGRAPYASLA